MLRAENGVTLGCQADLEMCLISIEMGDRIKKINW